MKRQRSRWRSQDGSIILVVGVVATLAILAAAMVVLVNNAQSNTGKDRQRTQAFNLAEGALDGGMARLASKWPYAPADAPTWDAGSFWTTFSTNTDPSAPVDYAIPLGGGARTQVSFFDNYDTNDDGVVGYGPDGLDDAYDTQSDQLMYVEAQGNVGRKSARVRALVRLNYVNLGLLPNVAVFTPGKLFVNSATTLCSEVLEPGTETAQAYDLSLKLNGTLAQITNNAGFQDINKMMSPEVLALLKTAAKSAVPSRYYTSQPPDAAFERGGLIYIDAPTVDINWLSSVKTSSTGDGIGADTNGIVWPPGALIVNAKSLKWQSNVVYYGLIYCKGVLDLQGTADIHGMLASASTSNDPPAISVSGNWKLFYNDNVRQNLNMEFPSNVTIERNSWREISPM